MKRENRLTYLSFCLGIILGIAILMAFQLFVLDILSLVGGIAVGWAVRDIMEPIEEKETEEE